VATFGDRTMTVGSCDDDVDRPADGVSVCVDRRHRSERRATGPGSFDVCSFQEADETARVRVTQGSVASGSLTIRATVRDPFGTTRQLPDRVMPIPMKEETLVDGVLKTPIGEIRAGVDLPDGLSRTLDEALKDTSGAPPVRDDETLPYLPCADEPSRRARLFWLAAKAYSRDLEIDDAEAEGLRKLLVQLGQSRVSCP
jgi:hypothetical protein